MKTIAIPFRLDPRGRIATATKPEDVVRQQITDILVTDDFQRVFLPYHGANLTGFLFSPVRDSLLQAQADTTTDLLNSKLSFGTVVRVLFEPDQEEETKIRVTVLFRLGPGGELLSLTKTFTGVVTEETVL